MIGQAITGQQFGVASFTSELPNGFMGVGPGIELTGYPTIVDTLATEGITQSRAFSLDLRGVDSTSGMISRVLVFCQRLLRLFRFNHLRWY
jgi:hypothetical protein